MSSKIPQNPIKFALYITRLHSKWAIGSLLCVFIGTGLDRLSVILLRNLTDAVATHPIVMQSIWMWAIAYPSISFIARNVWRGSGFFGMRWFMHYISSSYQILYDYLTLHSKDYFNNRFAGSLANKMSHAVEGTHHLLEKFLWSFFPLFIGLIWYIIFAWFSDWRLGCIITVWSIFFLSINVWFARKLQHYYYLDAKAQSTLKGRIIDSLSNISLVHEYGYVAGERDYIRKYIKKYHDAALLDWKISEWVFVINGIFVVCFMFLMISTSVYLFQNHLVSIGVVVMVIAIVADLSSQFVFLAAQMRDIGGYYGEAKEGLEEILQEHVIVNAPGASELEMEKGDIAVDTINFEYGKTSVFKDFSLVIPAGQKVGLVGRSGAGKTTLVSLLLRHFDVQGGAIKIDGQDIREITLESLRRAIAFVPQDTSLFHRTIRENIRYSNPHATDKEVEKAAKQALADDFIQQLPSGYETLVGERGIKLSGGQRQRIAIARAFLKNAPILILDEATSSLDSESEAAIQESLEKLMKGRTVIAIAHRLSTLKEMDRLILIQKGKIGEDGSPDELLKKKDGLFKKMWDHQVKGFIVDE